VESDEGPPSDKPAPRQAGNTIILIFCKDIKTRLKAGCIAFNAGCNEQVFSPKPCKNFDADPSYRFREKRTFNSEK